MLKRVSIQNFKSLKDVTLDLQKVNLLIGPNNSGKTNFLKALEFFTIGGMKSLNIPDFESISYKHQRVKIKYEFDFVQNPDGYMTKTYGGEGRYKYHYTRTAEVVIGDDFENVDSLEDDWFTDELGNKTDFQTFGGDRREFFEYISTRIFRPDPSKLIQSVKFSADEVMLSFDCSNLISFYFYVDNNYKKIARDIQDNLSRCIPEISYFTTPPVKTGNESFLGLRFFDKEENGYWANEVSEGVLYFLSLLCIIYQPNPPKLLLLEEPERGIHPRRIWEVMKFIFQLAEEKAIQIILTSHNEHVVNAFSSIPEAVFVFDKDEEGATQVRNLQQDIIEPSHKKSEELELEKIDFTENLGESWLYGLLGGVPKTMTKLIYTLISEGFAEYAFISAYLRRMGEKYSVQFVKSNIRIAVSANPSASKVLDKAEQLCEQALVGEGHELFIIGVDLDKADFPPELIHHKKRMNELISH